MAAFAFFKQFVSFIIAVVIFIGPERIHQVCDTSAFFSSILSPNKLLGLQDRKQAATEAYPKAIRRQAFNY